MNGLSLFLLGRFVSALLLLGGVAILVFFVTEWLPGDFAQVMLGFNASAENLDAFYHAYGLDKPTYVRFFLWISGLLQGDLGWSHRYAAPLSEILAERAGVTFFLSLASLAISVKVGFFLSFLAMRRPGSWFDRLIAIATPLGFSIPVFWLGILFIFFFAVKLGWFPASGFPPPEEGFLSRLHALVLPTASLVVPQIAIFSRLTRASLFETLQADYIKTARAKGMKTTQVLCRHAVPNALSPILTIIGTQAVILLTGVVIIEKVFNLPGVGRLFFQAVIQRDLFVIRNLVVFFAGAIIVVNFFVATAQGIIDPRLRRFL